MKERRILSLKRSKFPAVERIYDIPSYIVVLSVPRADNDGRVRRIASKFHERLTGRFVIYADKGAKLWRPCVASSRTNSIPRISFDQDWINTHEKGCEDVASLSLSQTHHQSQLHWNWRKRLSAEWLPYKNTGNWLSLRITNILIVFFLKLIAFYACVFYRIW